MERKEERLDAKAADRNALADAFDHLHTVVPVPEGACALRPCFLILADTADYINRLHRENEEICGRDRLANWLTANGQKYLQYGCKFN